VTNIKGEIDIEVVGIDLHGIKEINQSFYTGEIKHSTDITLHCKDKGCLTIHGKNDWGYLITDALQPLLNYAEQVFVDIDKRISNYTGKPEVIALGKNEFRAVDIMHKLRGLGDPIKIYKGIPVVRVNYDNKIELLGFSEELLF